jgi:hypothetical protein
MSQVALYALDVSCFHIVVSRICSFGLLAQSILIKRQKSFRRNVSSGLNHLSFNPMNLKTWFVFYFYYRNIRQIAKVKVAKCQGPWEELLIPNRYKVASILALLCSLFI